MHLIVAVAVLLHINDRKILVVWTHVMHLTTTVFVVVVIVAAVCSMRGAEVF